MPNVNGEFVCDGRLVNVLQTWRPVAANSISFLHFSNELSVQIRILCGGRTEWNSFAHVHSFLMAPYFLPSIRIILSLSGEIQWIDVRTQINFCVVVLYYRSFSTRNVSMRFSLCSPSIVLCLLIILLLIPVVVGHSVSQSQRLLASWSSPSKPIENKAAWIHYKPSFHIKYAVFISLRCLSTLMEVESWTDVAQTKSRFPRMASVCGLSEWVGLRSTDNTIGILCKFNIDISHEGFFNRYNIDLIHPKCRGHRLRQHIPVRGWTTIHPH